MVLVEYDEIPVVAVNELVLRLDAAVLVGAQKVLEGAEYDDRATLVRLGVLRVDVEFVVVRVLVGNKLPALKIDVRQKVFPPGALHGGLKGEHEHALKAHLFGELIGCKRLAEAHLGVPQKFRRLVRLVLFGRGVVSHRLLNGDDLFGAHLKGRRAVFLGEDAVAHLMDGGEHVALGAAEPLVLVIALVQAKEALAAQDRVNVAVGKAGAVVAHGGLDEDDLISNAACM